MGLGIALRTSGRQTWTECRQRGAAVAVGYAVMVDLASSDADTATWSGETGAKVRPGTQTSASSPMATVLPATAGLTHGRVGVCMGAAVKDNALGQYELGEVGDGTVAPVLVRACVKVDAASVAGVPLQIQTGGTFATGEAGQAFAWLLEDCTTDDKSGPSASLNFKWVVLHPFGLPYVGDLDTADIADLSVTTGKLAADAVTGAKLADDAVDSEHIAAAAVDREHMNEEASPITRWAPDFDLRLSPAGTTAHYVGDTWAPTAGDYTMAVTAIYGQLPGSNRALLGRDNTSHDVLNALTNGDLVIRSNASNLATITGGLLADREPHRYRMTRVANAITVYRDGVSIGTATATVAVSSTPAAYSFADGREAFTRIVYDCELTDPNAATNNVFMRLDRPGQLCLNACGDPSDPLYSANTANLGGSITSTPTSTGRPAFTLVTTYRAGAMPARSHEMAHPPRMAAYSGLGAASTDGYWASIAHVPTANASYDISFDYTGNVLPSATAYAVGSSFNGPRFSLGTDGAISLTYITTGVASGATVTKVVDGRTHRIRATMVQNGANVDGVLYVDGRFVGSGSTAGTIASGDFYIGASATNTQRCPGAITNVRILDVTTAANSIELLMDEPSGNFTNVYPSTTAAASATRRGYVPMRAIPSTDGRGMPWVGNQGSLAYGARLNAAAAGITGVTTYTIVGLTEDERDPSASYAAGVFTAPAAGEATFMLTASIAATTLAGADDITLNVTQSVTADVYSATATLAAANQYSSLSVGGIVTIAKGETLTASFDSLLVGDVYTIAAGACFKIEFRPTPTAG